MQPAEQTIERHNIERLAAGLGWFSVGLGLAELLAPRELARLIGVRETPRNLAVLGACGAREVSNGMAILAQPRRSAWLWSRVGGDMLDLALLGAAADERGRRSGRASVAAAAVAGVTALDFLCAEELTRGERRSRGEILPAVHVARAMTINRPPDEVYRFWKQLENLPRFMRHLESVETDADGRTRWVARGPAGTSVSWRAEIVDDRENERIAWRSLPDSEIENRGTVTLEAAPGGRGTELHVELSYVPPAGRLGRGLAWLFGEEPGQQIAADLRRAKQLLELGEVVASGGEGLRRPARPIETHHDLPVVAGGQS